jgi:hypothetical protein
LWFAAPLWPDRHAVSGSSHRIRQETIRALFASLDDARAFID